MSLKKVSKLLIKYFNKDITTLIINLLVHKPEHCKLTHEICDVLNFEFYEKGDDIEELPIFDYRFIDIGDFYPLFVVNYMTYDHHNEPRCITVLKKVGGKWRSRKYAESYRRTKYTRCPEYEIAYQKLYSKYFEYK